jgi:hypothetical protein
MALSLGASGVWVGTRFVCAEEAALLKITNLTSYNAITSTDPEFHHFA